MVERMANLEGLELDIDLALRWLWIELDKDVQAGRLTEEDLVLVVAYVRASYGQGYIDALNEETPADLATRRGYEDPRKNNKWKG